MEVSGVSWSNYTATRCKAQLEAFSAPGPQNQWLISQVGSDGFLP